MIVVLNNKTVYLLSPAFSTRRRCAHETELVTDIVAITEKLAAVDFAFTQVEQDHRSIESRRPCPAEASAEWKKFRPQHVAAHDRHPRRRVFRRWLFHSRLDLVKPILEDRSLDNSVLLHFRLGHFHSAITDSRYAQGGPIADGYKASHYG